MNNSDTNNQIHELILRLRHENKDNDISKLDIKKLINTLLRKSIEQSDLNVIFSEAWDAELYDIARIIYNRIEDKTTLLRMLIPSNPHEDWEFYLRVNIEKIKRIQLDLDQSRTNKSDWIRYEAYILKALWKSVMSWPYIDWRGSNPTPTEPILAIHSLEVLHDLSKLAKNFLQSKLMGFDLNQAVHSNKTILDIVIKQRYVGAIHILKSLGISTRPSVYLDTVDSRSELLNCCRDGTLSDIRRLIKIHSYPAPFLHELAYEALLLRKYEIIIFLESIGIGFNNLIHHENGSTILHEVIDLDVNKYSLPDSKALEYLIDKGFEINALDVFCRTPLDVAMEANHKEAFVFLRENGAKSFYEIQTDFCTQYKLSNKKNQNVYSIFEDSSKSYTNYKTKQLNRNDKENIIKHSLSGDISGMQSYVDEGTDLINEKEAFEAALSAGHLDICTLMIRNGLHTSIISPIMFKVIKETYALEPSKNKKALEIILESNTPVNTILVDSKNVFTPLDYVILSNRKDYLKLLRNAGALTFREIENLDV